MKTTKIVISLFALILLVNLVESSFDCYRFYRRSDGTCHNGFGNKQSAYECCDLGAEAFDRLE